MIITTTDLKNEYEVLDIVYHYHTGLLTKKLYGKDATNEIVVHKLKEEIAKKAADLGANAVVGFKFDFEPTPGAMAVHQSFHVYGTAVKLK